MDVYDIILFVAYAMVGVAALAALGMPLASAADNPKSLKGMGVSLLALAVIFVVSYLLAGSDVTLKQAADFDLTVGSSKMIGGILFTTYILTAIAVVGIVYSEISKMLK